VPGVEAVLTDFGMAVSGALVGQHGVRGKPSYQAPEMHADDTYDARLSDLFAVGVLAYALVVGNYPWSSTRPGSCVAFGYAQSHSLEALFHKRRLQIRGVRVPVGQIISPEMKRLLLTLMDFDPARRLAALDLPQPPAHLTSPQPRCEETEAFWGA
jgi:serine/threonine protein kinase